MPFLLYLVFSFVFCLWAFVFFIVCFFAFSFSFSFFIMTKVRGILYVTTEKKNSEDRKSGGNHAYGVAR